MKYNPRALAGGAADVLYEIATVGLIFAAGYFASRLIPVPGSLLSMMLFFVLLLTGVVDSGKYRRASGLLLRHMAFFFIPPAVQILEAAAMLSGRVWKLVLILLISNVLVMGVTGLTVQFFMKRTETEND